MEHVREMTVYDSARRGNSAVAELRELFNYRYLIWQLVRRDVLTRYKRSFLGIAWTMLNPLGMMIVLTLAFSHVLKVGNIHSYPGYVLSGLLVWNFFGQTTTAAMVNLVWGGSLLNRIYIPRASFAVAAVGTGLVNLLLALVPLILVLVVGGVPPNLSILWLWLPMLLLACFSLGLGLTISTFAVYFPDVAEMYQIALTGWMYLTPIIYDESILPEAYRFWVTRLNPMYYLVKLYRIPVYYGRSPTLEEVLPALAIALVVLVAGWIIFAKRSDEFAYRI